METCLYKGLDVATIKIYSCIKKIHQTTRLVYTNEKERFDGCGGSGGMRRNNENSVFFDKSVIN